MKQAVYGRISIAISDEVAAKARAKQPRDVGITVEASSVVNSVRKKWPHPTPWKARPAGVRHGAKKQHSPPPIEWVHKGVVKIISEDADDAPVEGCQQLRIVLCYDGAACRKG
jgi:hypothetical protein